MSVSQDLVRSALGPEPGRFYQAVALLWSVGLGVSLTLALALCWVLSRMPGVEAAASLRGMPSP